MANSPRDQINKHLADFELRYSAELDDLSHDVERLRQATDLIEQSWSGSFNGWHGRMYFHGFQKAAYHERFSSEWGAIHGMPDGWEEKDNKQVQHEIDRLVGNGFSVDLFEKRVARVRDALNELRTDVSLLASGLAVPATGKAQDYLKELESSEIDEAKESPCQ